MAERKKSATSKGAPTKARARKKGKKLRPGPRSKAVRENLEYEVYRLRVLEAWSVKEVCAGLGMSSKTVLAYEKAELERRSAEREERKPADAEVAIARYERIYRKGIELAERADKAFMQPLIRGLDSAAKAQERIDKIKGIEAPVRVDVSVQQLVDALEIPEDEGKA